MILKPVRQGAALSLSDREAKRPQELPDKDALNSALDDEQKKLGALQDKLMAGKQKAVLVIFQGRDASGKDGAIKKVFEECNPQGCRVTSFGVPTALELSHDYLWRIHAAIPPRGIIGIFNRSHYEDVIAVRVKKLAPEKVWRARFDQINNFERMLAANDVVILKFFLHVSKAEQRERLIDRLEDPHENWKFRAGDLDDRKLWPMFTAAYRDALSKCSTTWAPWYIVPADSKTARNYLITRTLVKTLEGLRLSYPKARPEVLALKGSI